MIVGGPKERKEISVSFMDNLQKTSGNALPEVFVFGEADGSARGMNRPTRRTYRETE